MTGAVPANENKTLARMRIMVYAFRGPAPRKNGPCGAVQHQENKRGPPTSQISWWMLCALRGLNLRKALRGRSRLPAFTAREISEEASPDHILRPNLSAPVEPVCVPQCRTSDPAMFWIRLLVSGTAYSKMPGQAPSSRLPKGNGLRSR